MADETQKIILELTLNSQQLLGELGKVKTSQRSLQAENRALQKDLDKLASFKLQGKDEYKALEVQIAKNSRELVGLSREAANLNKNLDATEAAAGSYNAMAAATAVLQKNLKEAAVGVNITQEAYDELNQKVQAGLAYQRDFARQSGDMRALVGAYKEELGPSIDGVAAKLGVANDSLAAMEGLLKELKSQQKSISPFGEEAQTVAQQVAELEAQIETAKKAMLSANNEESIAATKSLTGLRQRLEALQKVRETIEPGTAAMKDLNGEILGIQTTIQEAEGKIDEFGEKVKKNAKKEDIDTVADAFGGLTAAITVASLFMGDNTNAEKLNAEAMRAVAVAQSLRSIQIGIASAKDAAGIIIAKAKNLILVEEKVATVAATVATEAQTAATVGATVATEASLAATEGQAVATEVATVAQEGLNVAMKLNPIGLVVIAVVALVGALTLLYNKFKAVRDFLAPLVAGFKALGQAASDALGLSDTAAEKAVAAQQKVIDAIQTTAKTYELEAKRLELAGAKTAEYRAQERQGLVLQLQAYQKYQQDLYNLRLEGELQGKEFSDAQKKTLLETTQNVLAQQNALTQFDIDTKNKLAQEAKAAEAAAKAARDLAKKLLEEQLKLQREQLQVQLGYVKIRLETAQNGSNEERLLLIKQADLTRKIELAQAGLTNDSKKLINAGYRAEEAKINTAYARQQAVTDLAIAKELLEKQITAAGQGTQAQLQLKRQLVATEYQLELAGLDQKANNVAKELELKRAAKEKLVALAIEEEAQLQDILSKGQQQRVQALKQAADLMLAGLGDGPRQQLEASQGYLNARLGALAAASVAELSAVDSKERQLLLSAGENEAEQTRIKRDAEAQRQAISKQYAIDSLNLQQETATKAQQIEAAKYQKLTSVVQESMGAIATITDAAQQIATSRLDASTQAQLALAGNDAKKREKIIAESNKQKERLEKEYAEKRRRMAIVQAIINGALAITEILRSPAAPFVEPFASAVRAVEIGLVVGTTVAQVAALNSQKFARGGVVKGPSHSQGGVQMLHTSGAHLGEMEGNEIVLTAEVYRNPLLRGLASTINEMAGGASFAGSSLTTASVRKMAAGGVVSYDPGAYGPQASSAAAGAGVDIGSLARAIGLEFAQALANLPTPKVAVEEITQMQNKIAITTAAADIS